MKKIHALIYEYWRLITTYFIAIATASAALLIHLSTKPAKLSSAEVNNLRQSMTWHAIINNPLNLPLRLLERLAFYIAPHNVMLLRLPSVIIGLVIICLIVGVVRHWYGLKAAVVTSLLLATSSIFLADARQATPSILMFGLVLLLAIRSWLTNSTRRILPLLAAITAITLALYVPGFIWFIAAAVIWRYKFIQRCFNLCYIWQKVCLLGLGIIIILPLIWSAIRLPSLLYSIFGLPRQFNLITMWRNLYHIPLDLFIRSSLSPSQIVPHIPILNIFEICMFILGIYSLWYFRKSDRFKSLSGLCVMAILLITIGGPVSINLLLPIIYIVITVGIFYMLENWMYIFPINPIARTIGIIVLSCAVGISCWYHLDSYYIAWQNDPTTQIVFNQSVNNI
jgi:hypothetical protein